MAISYTEEAKYALLDTGASNWGAIVNGLLEQIDQGYELNFTAAESITQYDVVYVNDENKAGVADADDAAKRPGVGIALNSASVDDDVQVLMFGWLDYDDTSHGGALGASNGDTIYLSTTAGYLSTTPDTDYPQVMGIAKTDTTANITRIFFSPVLHVHQLVDKDDAPTFERVTIIPIRGTDDYEYGLRVDSDGFFIAGAAKKTYMAHIGGDRLDGEVVTGDSNDALLRMSHSNYAACDGNFIMRGINGSLSNRDSGTMNMLEGINYSVRQRGDAGAINTLRGAYISIQMDVGSGAVSSAVKGLKVDMRCEANCPADSAGIEVRNYTDGVYDIPTTAFSVKNNGTSGCKGFEYGLDLYDASARTVNTADIRGSNEDIINNSSGGIWDLDTAVLHAAGAVITNVSVTSLDITGITDGNVPYMSASGFADSSIQTDGTKIGIGVSPSYTLHVAVAGGGTQSIAAFLNTEQTNDAAEVYVGSDVSANNCIVIGYETASDGSLANNFGYIKTHGQTALYFRNNNIGINEIDPVTLLEMTHTAPYFTLHNSTEEDSDGGRECRIIARGEQSGGEETALAYDEWCHDGAADDQLGMRRFYLNDGDDGATPSVLALSLRNTGVTFGRTACFSAEVDNGNSGAADTVDWTVGNKQKSTLTGDCTYTFDPDPIGPCSLTLRLIQDGTGGRDATWPGEVTWLGTEPTWSDGAAGKSIVVSFYYDGSTYWAQATSWEA